MNKSMKYFLVSCLCMWALGLATETQVASGDKEYYNAKLTIQKVKVAKTIGVKPKPVQAKPVNMDRVVAKGMETGTVKSIIAPNKATIKQINRRMRQSHIQPNQIESGRCTDCQGNDCTGYESWVGDGWCDDGAYGFYFDCDEFNCDEGDCDCGGEEPPACEFLDCQGQEACGYESWVGDGYCDDGAYGFYFDCDEFNCDEGDCDCSGEEPECTFYDCIGQCAEGYESWVGDGWCDDGAYGLYFDCDEFGNDGGDCDPTEPTEGCEDCEFDFTPYGAECCDAAWDAFGLSCADLEGNYGWDCSGCACPGDIACEDQGLITCDDGSCAASYDDCAAGCDFFDCQGQEACGYESWVGDGYCDDGTWGLYFNCEEFDNDAGDCDPEESCEDQGLITCDDGSCAATADECVEDPYPYCAGNTSWIGDGWCDSSNNNADCGFDAGDCCPGDCVDAAYSCDTYGGDCEDCVDPDSADIAEGGQCDDFVLTCADDEWMCADGLECIPASYYCDGSVDNGNAGWGPDCDDESDEIMDECCEAGLYDDETCGIEPEPWEASITGLTAEGLDYYGDSAVQWTWDALDDGIEFSCPEGEDVLIDCAGVEFCNSDCAGTSYDGCVSGENTWIGDGYCDDGAYGLVLDCPEYDCDGCDCGDADEYGCASEGYCAPIEVDLQLCLDTFTVVGATDLDGDEIADDCYSDGSGYFYFNWEGNCEATALMGGDGEVMDLAGYGFTAGFYYYGFEGNFSDFWTMYFGDAEAYGEATTGDCGGEEPGDCEFFDCIGQEACGYESWIGDGWCDDGAYGVYFD